MDTWDSARQTAAMSESTAEVAYLPLKAGVGGLDKGDSPKIWNDTLKTVTSQPGCKGAYWGIQIEHPDIIELVVGMSPTGA